MRGQRRRTIFLDLDDTLIDTFGLLITPLERAAAEEICAIEGSQFTPERLTEILLKLRKQNPAELREKLRELSNPHADQVLAARDQIFADFSVEALTISTEVVAVVKSLMPYFELVLVTEGRPKLQCAKVEHLGIRKLFDDVLVMDPASGSSKEMLIKNYMDLGNITPAQAIIVGNRLDREIIAGNRLGVRTIWLRAGEGSEMEPRAIEAKADVDIDNFAELPIAIRKLVALE
jgi:putative hydrolase of the HAD superfamily